MPRRAQFKVRQSRTVFKGKLISIKVDHVTEPGKVNVVREVVCHPGSVVVIPHLPDGRILLVRQFRYAAGEQLWELVAGGLEPGETATQAAHREMIEETGFRCDKVTPLFHFFPSPGILTEKMHLVEACGLSRAKAQPDSDERISVGRFTLAQIRALLHARKIKDAKTLVGLYYLMGQNPRTRV